MKVAAMAVTPEDDADSSDCTSHHRGGSKGVESRNDSNGKNTTSASNPRMRVVEIINSHLPLSRALY